MRTMVTGGAGFIGSTLVDRLLAEGHQVDVVDDLSSGSLANLAEARTLWGRGLTVHQLDIRRPDTIELMTRRKPEVVFHLAAHEGYGAPADRPALDAEVNVIGSLNVLEGARAAGAERVVFAASGTTLYGLPAVSDLPVRESHPHRPRTPHGVGKKAVIDYLVAYRDLYALEFVALALASVYGPRQDPVRGGVVAAFADRVVAGEPVVIEGSGKQTRDFVYVDDVADAFVRAATRGGGLVCNVGTGQELSVVELYRVMVAAVDAVVEPTYVPGRVGDIARLSLNIERAAIQLGWKPWTTIAEGTRSVLEDRRRGRDGRARRPVGR
jgi:UDP-glucose 4-epimerase